MSEDRPKLDLITRLDDLERVRDDWLELQSHPWSDFAFFTQRLAREDGFVRPHVLRIEHPDGRRSLCVASIASEEIAWRIGSATVLRSRARVLRLGTGSVMGDDSGETAAIVVHHVLERLAAGDADVAYLHQIREESPLVEAAASIPGVLTRDPFVRRAPRWVLDLPATFDEFVASRSKSVKKGLKRNATLVRREIPDARVARYSKPEDFERIVADCDEVARRTYQDRLGVGFRNDEATRDRVAWMLGQGWLLAQVLYDGARPVAYWHHLRYGQELFTRETGFDTDYARARPGSYLMRALVEERCGSEQTRRIDFGTMAAEYKRHFGSSCSDLVSLYLFAPSLRGRWMFCLRAATGAAEWIARRVLGANRARKLSRRLTRRPS